MSKVAVVTLVTHPDFRRLADITLPSQRDYARRIGAEYLVLDKRVYPHPQYDKWQIGDLFDRYDRLIFLDADIVVRQDCPDLFAIVPPQEVGGENELLTFPSQAQHLAVFAERMGIRQISCPFYINTGLMVASACHRDLFRSPEHVFNDLPWPEQTHFNLRLLMHRVPLCLLPQGYNDRHRRGDYLRQSFVLHYSCMANDERVTAARHDLAAWDKLFEHARKARTPTLHHNSSNVFCTSKAIW